MIMNKFNQITIHDRTYIESAIKLELSCLTISKKLGRSESTIRREIKNNRYMTSPNPFNNYAPRTCECALKFPYVCNICPKRNSKKCYKYYYEANKAQIHSDKIRSFSRTGCQFDIEHFDYIDKMIIDGLSKNQPLNHIIIANELGVSTSTCYRWINQGILSSKIIDLRKAVRFPQKDKKEKRSMNRKHRIGRTHDDYLAFIATNPSLSVVEMDTVEGLKSENPCILTFAWLTPGLFMAHLMDRQTSLCVVETINKIEEQIGIELFKEIFTVILTDNGSEFSNATKIEYSHITGEKRTDLFYCDPNRPDQKGTVERKHVEMRLIIPKGKSISHLTQKKVDLICSHVNAVVRPTLNNKTTYEFTSFLHNEEILSLLNIDYVHKKDVLLKPELVK